MPKPMLSIVVPCYNEQETVALFVREIDARAEELSRAGVEIELLFVNDGSKDATLATVQGLAAADPRIRYLSFSRNFGKEAAMYAGLANCRGDFVALMDADLQDPPALLPEMLAAVQSGEYDCVATRRSTRKGEPAVRSFFSRMFYRVINRISSIDIVDGARDFRLMNRRMVDALLSMKEYNRFSKGLFSWVGYRVKWLSYENIERVAGTTKWSFWKLFKYSIDGILEFSVMPLAISSFLGVFISLLAFAGIIFIVVRTLAYGDPVSGWPSLVSIVAFIGGLQLLCLGVIGQYLAKTYLETKRRPKFLVRETNVEHVKYE